MAGTHMTGECLAVERLRNMSGWGAGHGAQGLPLPPRLQKPGPCHLPVP